MPYFMMLGVQEERFWDSAPIDLEPYRKMDELQQKRIDHQMWQMGAYINNAVSVAVSNVLGGKKSKARYLEKPFYQMVEEEEKRTPTDDFNKFQAWAIVFNENFTKSNGQG